MVEFFKNIDFQRSYVAFSETPDHLFLLHQVKCVYNGHIVILLLKCQRMYSFGGCDATHVKAAIYDAFKQYGIDLTSDDDAKKLISVCADGASVNMGIYHGALTMIKEDIPWIIKIHCALHCLELAIKDACLSYDHFTQVNDMLVSIYTMFKNSGKCWRLMLMLAERMNAKVRRHPKVTGTRFVGHKLNGLKVFNNNLGVLVPFAQNALSSKGLLTEIMTAKVKGYITKWTDFGWLSNAVIYQEVLRAVSKLSKFLERDEVAICEMIDVRCVTKIIILVSRKKGTVSFENQYF